MDAVRKLWDMLVERQITLYLDDGKLKTRAAPGSVTQDIATLIRSHRDALIAMLSSVGSSPIAGRCIPRASGGDDSATVTVTASQRRLWLSQSRAGASAIYNVPLAVELSGPLDETALATALRIVVERHDALRTHFVEIDGNLAARLRSDVFVLGRHDATSVNAGALARELAAKPFDLSVDALFRADLIRAGAGEHLLVLCMHHIVADGWSCGILVKELETLYNAAIDRSGATLPELPIQFSDYANWLATPEQQELEEENLAYWREQLRDVPAVHALPLDHPRPRVQSYEGADSDHTLSAELAEALRTFARRQGTTVYCTLQAVLALLISRWSNEREVVFGTSTSGRSHPELEGLVGFFINPIVLRNRIDDDATVAAYVASAQALLLGAVEHQQIAFERIVDEVLPARSTSHAPIFQFMFDYRHGTGPAVTLSELACRPIPLGSQGAKYDIEVTATESPQHIHLRWIYATRLFDKETIARLQRSFETLLAAFVASPDRSLAELPFLPPDEAAFIAAAGTGAAVYLPTESLAERFDAIAQGTPEAIAVEHADETFTYAEVRGRANRLAQFLRKLGLRTGQRVAIYLEPGPELVVAVLATLKAGGTYVPVDPVYPENRVEYMLDDAGVDIVLCSQHAMEEGAFVDRKVVPVDMVVQDALFASQPDESPNLSDDGGDPAAYVLYTSGSTGKPKGVVVGQNALIHYLQHASKYFRDDMCGAVVSTSIGFDATVTSLLAPLILGKRVALLDSGLEALFSGLERYLFDEGNAWLFKVTPSHIAALAHVCAGRGASQVRHVLIIGGEQLDYAMVHAWRSRWLPAASYVNEYGPTEATVGCSTYTIDAGDTDVPTKGPVSIGRPIANVRMYAIAAGQVVPVGAVGELYIGGAGLADGYMNLLETSAERFVTLPAFGPEMRFYRTGDLVRLRPDGLFEFVKRVDDQLKVRGYRIEAGEIESALRAIEGIREAAVAVQEEGTQRVLVAFIQPVDSAVDRSSLQQRVRQEASKALPDYMLPSVVEVIADLPLTVNGKVDRAALPRVDIAASLGLNYVAPVTDLETMLCVLWQEATGLEKVGIHDNFLEIGGNSLMFVKLRGDIEHRLGRKLDITAFFEYPTIAELARHLQADNVASSVTEMVGKTGGATVARGAIAIIAMAGRFPEAADTDALWRNLLDGKEALRTFSNEELVTGGFSPDVVSRADFVPVAAIVDGVKDFDADFFRMTPREAELMDPQQRLLFECTVTALERAGYGNMDESLHCGVFVGCGESTYLAQNLLPQTELLRNLGLSVLHANSNHYVATRLAYKLNLTGPAVNVATACSTSLVAVHQAINSLRLGECDMAVAGGAGVSEFDVGGYLYQEGGIESPDGRCRAFDADARGTRGGNGAGVVLLRRLEDAIRDGDTILAVLRGSAMNNDGSQKAGYTAPGVSGQAKVIAAALRDADLAPGQIQYVETHGTGTPLGDPVEFRALSRAFQSAPAGNCVLGTLKPNIGHLDAAAGIAGLIKTIHVVRDGVIPPSIHFERPNPLIDLAGSPFYFSREARPWTTADDTPRRAGVSAFGIGGTNVHVIVEQAPPLFADGHASAGGLQLLPLSARSEAGLEAQVVALRTHLERNVDTRLADIAFTLQSGRRQQPWRTFVVAGAHDTAVAGLADSSRLRVRCHAEGRKRSSVVLMFPGQGAQYAGMGLGLLGTAPRFTEVFEHCRALVLGYASFDILEVLQQAAGSDALLPTQVAQPTLFAVEYALATQLLDSGIQPDAMIGHSLGEFVAACVSGVFDLDDAIRLICERARLMQVAGPGAMLAVSARQDRVASLPASAGLAVAATNGPENLVYSGETAAIAALESALEAADIACRRLQTSHAFHSPMMKEAAEGLRSVFAHISLRKPSMRFVSNVTGAFIDWAQACDPEYWVRHLLAPVQFAQGLDTLYAALQEADKEVIFVEAGPGGGLSTLVQRHPRAASALVVPVMRRAQEHGDDAAYWLAALGTLWSAGCELNWAHLHVAEKARRVPLPTSRFERKRHWVDRPSAVQRRSHSAASGGFYLPTWELAPTTSPSLKPVAASSSWLLLSDDCGIGAALAERIRLQGAAECLSLPGSDGDAGFDELVDRLDDQGELSIACLWPLTVDGTVGTDAAERFEAAQQRTLYPLRTLLTTIAERRPRLHVRLVVVTDRIFRVTGNESLQPAYATLRGLCKVVAQENPQFACRLIDVDAYGIAEGGQDLLAGRIWREIQRGGDIPEMALRGSSRWLRHYVPLAESRIATARPRIASGGHYLITGGLGRMGLHIARWLCVFHGARVTLLGRRDFPSASEWEHSQDCFPAAVASQVSWLRALRDQGASIEVCRADVADRQALEAAVVNAERAFGALDGVFHAAGNVADSLTPFAVTTEATFGNQFGSKVMGLMHLEDILRSRSVDFCVVMSSLAAELGGLGFTAYAAANAYADAFVQAMRNAGDDRWCSIDWDGWNFSANTGAAPGLEHTMGPEEGIRALAMALDHADQPLIVHSSTDLDTRFARWVGMADCADAVVTHEEPVSSRDFVPPETPSEVVIADIWRQMLGIERIGTNDNFFELGGDSLLVTRLVAKIRAHFDVHDTVLSLADFFANPTVFHVASRIDKHSVAAGIASRQSQLRMAEMVEEGEF